MRGRKSDGSWIEPFDPLAWGGVYTEGNAWQWLWSVQQDVPGLMELMGGKDGVHQETGRTVQRRRRRSRSAATGR